MNRNLRMLFLTVLIAAFCIPQKAAAQGAQIPGGNFEEWTVDTVALPFDIVIPWATHSHWMAVSSGPGTIPFNVSKTFITTAQGLFAAELETVDYSVFGLSDITVPGIVTNGETRLDGLSDVVVEGGKPWTDRPDSLHAFFAYTPAAGDSAWMSIEMWKNDGSGRETVGSATFRLGDATTPPGMEQFGVEINYASMDDPDSMFILISSSHPYNTDTNMIGSKLIVDTVWVTYPEVEPPMGLFDRAENSIGVDVFPTPASGTVWFDNPANENLQLMIYNLEGRLVLRQVLSSGRQSVSVAILPVGTYAWQAVTRDGSASDRGRLVIK